MKTECGAEEQLPHPWASTLLRNNSLLYFLLLVRLYFQLESLLPRIRNPGTTQGIYGLTPPLTYSRFMLRAPGLIIMWSHTTSIIHIWKQGGKQDCELEKVPSYLTYLLPYSATTRPTGGAFCFYYWEQ